MKKIPLIIFLIIGLVGSANSQLPSCYGSNTSNYNNCYGKTTFNRYHPNWPGATYIGEWKNGKPDGKGTATFPSGEKYVGDLKDGKSHGRGVFTEPNIKSRWINGNPPAIKYDGEWINDKRHGRGTGIWADGSRWEGQWKNDAAQGEGTLFHSNGSKYVGEVINFNNTVVIHGKGVAYWEGGARAGDMYVGEFLYDEMSGLGTYTYANGRIQEGMFKNNEFQYAKNINPTPKITKCNPGYVKVSGSCKKDNKLYSASSGSGFAVSSKGHVVTNFHVIEGCSDIKIHDKGKEILAEVVSFDPNNDIALLRGDFRPRAIFPLSRKSPTLLMDIYVAGHPFGKDISSSVKVTKGIVSSLTGVSNNYSNLQIDAAVQPGNSGGPIINDKGNVIGVAVSKLDLGASLEIYGVVPENVNFGVKSGTVINIMESENIRIPEPNQNLISSGELGEMITDGTFYLSCWMTLAQIDKLSEEKVMFTNLK